MVQRTATTNATGQSEGIPDLATIQITAIDEGESAATARGAARDRVTTIKDSLTGVSLEGIKTTDVSIEHSSELFETDISAEYRSSEALQIKCEPETVVPAHPGRND